MYSNGSCKFHHCKSHSYTKLQTPQALFGRSEFGINKCTQICILVQVQADRLLVKDLLTFTIGNVLPKTIITYSFCLSPIFLSCGLKFLSHQAFTWHGLLALGLGIILVCQTSSTKYLTTFSRKKCLWALSVNVYKLYDMKLESVCPMAWAVTGQPLVATGQVQFQVRPSWPVIDKIAASAPYLSIYHRLCIILGTYGVVNIL
jgi:hypothetical protein